MSNRLKLLIGKEGEKEIKSAEKKQRKRRRWRGERGCDHGRLEAASENDGAGIGRALEAGGEHGRQGVGKMGEEEIGQRTIVGEGVKGGEGIGEDRGFEDGGRRRGARGEGTWAEGFFFFLRGSLERGG